MNSIEQKELHNKLDELIRNSNGWDRINTFFQTNHEIQPFFKETSEECLRDGCYSLPVIYVMTIEKLLNKVI